MNFYYIENEGCDDTTRALIELTPKKAKEIQTMFEHINFNADSHCTPHINLYELKSIKKAYEGCWSYIPYNGENYTVIIGEKVQT